MKKRLSVQCANIFGNADYKAQNKNEAIAMAQRAIVNNYIYS